MQLLVYLPIVSQHRPLLYNHGSVVSKYFKRECWGAPTRNTVRGRVGLLTPPQLELVCFLTRLV